MSPPLTLAEVCPLDILTNYEQNFIQEHLNPVDLLAENTCELRPKAENIYDTIWNKLANKDLCVDLLHKLQVPGIKKVEARLAHSLLFRFGFDEFSNSFQNAKTIHDIINVLLKEISPQVVFDAENYDEGVGVSEGTVSFWAQVEIKYKAFAELQEIKKTAQAAGKKWPLAAADERMWAGKGTG